MLSCENTLPPAPAPKSHLFLNKLRRISSIDRDIRKKWSQLQQKKLQGEQKHFKDIINFQKRQKMANSLLRNELHMLEPQMNRVNRIRSEILREEVHLRHKRNEDIFFRKRDPKVRVKASPEYKNSNR